MTAITEAMLDAAYEEWYNSPQPKLFDGPNAYRAWLHRIITAALKAEELPQVPRPLPVEQPILPHRVTMGSEAGAMQFTALQAGRDHTTISMYGPHGVTLLHPPGDYVTIEFNGTGETLASLKLPVRTWEHLKQVGYKQDRAKFDLPVPEDYPIRFTVGDTIESGKTIGISEVDEVQTRYPARTNAVELVFKVKGVATARLALSRAAYAMIQLDACRWLADDLRNTCDSIMATIQHNANTGEAVGAEAGLKTPLT